MVPFQFLCRNQFGTYWNKIIVVSFELSHSQCFTLGASDEEVGSRFSLRRDKPTRGCGYIELFSRVEGYPWRIKWWAKNMETCIPTITSCPVYSMFPPIFYNSSVDFSTYFSLQVNRALFLVVSTIGTVFTNMKSSFPKRSGYLDWSLPKSRERSSLQWPSIPKLLTN